jgi:cell division transport system ATP-binding protein
MSNPIISLKNVCKRYGGYYALKNITLDIEKNEFVLITGPSGAGKTTLLKLLYLGEAASGGKIVVNSNDFSKIKKKEIPNLRKKIGLVFQDFKLINSKTVFENISFVLEAIGMTEAYIINKTKHLLKLVGMENKINSYPLSLSGGEQQRIAIARAVSSNPDIIIADEPTGSLDYDSANIILDLLADFYFNGATILLATHDKRLVGSSNCRHIHLESGQITSI